MFRSLVNFLTDIKLKANFCRPNTHDKVKEEVGFTVPYPIILQIEPSTIITSERIICHVKARIYIVEFPVMQNLEYI